MKKRKKIIKISIDQPAAPGAGTQAKLISKHYNLLHLDTGRCYRYVANIKISNPLKYNFKYVRKKIKKLKVFCTLINDKDSLDNFTNINLSYMKQIVALTS